MDLGHALPCFVRFGATRPEHLVDLVAEDFESPDLTPLKTLERRRLLRHVCALAAAAAGADAEDDAEGDAEDDAAPPAPAPAPASPPAPPRSAVDFLPRPVGQRRASTPN